MADCRDAKRALMDCEGGRRRRSRNRWLEAIKEHLRGFGIELGKQQKRGRNGAKSLNCLQYSNAIYMCVCLEDILINESRKVI